MGHLRPLAALRADGEEFPIEATIARVAIDGHPYYAAIVRDITARRRDEASLQRQADLLDLAYDAIFTWNWNGQSPSGTVVPSDCTATRREDAIGQFSRDLLRTRLSDGLAGVLRTLDREGVWEGELTHTRRDGSAVLVESRLVLVDGREVLLRPRSDP